MSTNVNTYVLYGVVLDYDLVSKSGDDASYERCEPYMDGDELNPKGNVVILYDGMNGEYVAVGHAIAKTDDWRHFDDPISLDGHEASISGWEQDVATALREIQVETTDKCGWHIISLYH